MSHLSQGLQSLPEVRPGCRKNKARNSPTSKPAKPHQLLKLVMVSPLEENASVKQSPNPSTRSQCSDTG
jgi:hypothetical protein